MGVGGQSHAPAALPPGKTRYPLYRELGGPQGRSGRVREISPPRGFEPQTVKPVASRYTDCAIPAAKMVCASLETGALYAWRFHNLDSLSKRIFEINNLSYEPVLTK